MWFVMLRYDTFCSDVNAQAIYVPLCCKYESAFSESCVVAYSFRKKSLNEDDK